MDPRDPNVPGEAAPTAEPSKALAGIGAAMPVFFALSCCLITPLSVDGPPTRFVQEMGPSFFFVVIAGAGAVITAAVLLFLAGLGKRVPSAFAIGVAALPWVVGLAGARYGMYLAESAVAFAAPSDRSTLIAMGIAEASLAHIFGAMVSVGALLGVGCGFAITALGQRAPDKKIFAAALGLLALPMLGAALWLFSIWGLRGPFAPLLVALLSVVVVGAAAAAIGKDVPRHRSGALAVAAAAAAALSFVAASSAGAMSALVEVFGALGLASPSARGELLANAAADVSPYQTIAKFGLLLGFAPLLGLAAWATARVRPSPGRLAGAAAVAIVLVVVPVMDRVAISGGADAMRRSGASLPWDGVADFQPTGLDSQGSFVEARALITPAGLASVETPLQPTPLSDRAGASERLAQLATAGDVDDVGMADILEVEPETSVGIAVDHRVDGPSLAALFAAAADAELSAIDFVGVSGEALDPESRATVEHAFPMLAFLTEPTPSAVRVQLAAVGAAGASARLAQADEVLFAVVGPSPDVTLTPVDGRGTTTDLRPDEEFANRRREAHGLGYAYLEIGDGATAASFLRAASRAADLGFEVVVATDGPPTVAAALGELTGLLGALGDAAIAGGAFEELDSARLEDLLRALGQPSGTDGGGLGGTGGLGRVGVGGGTMGSGAGMDGTLEPDRQTARVRLGPPTVRGSLSRALVQRVMRSRIGTFRYCYERSLAQTPGLTGRLSLSFVISPAGAVTSAEVSENTSGDAELGTCVSRTARRVRFPAPEGGGIVIVEQPVEFDAP